MILPFASLLVVRTTDSLEAFPNIGWRNQRIAAHVAPSDWPSLQLLRAESWLQDDEMAFVNRQTVRACGDYFVWDDNGRIVLHVRREPRSREPFPTVAQAVINGALWPSGGMLVKPTESLDGKLSFAGALLVKLRTELASYLTSPDQILGIHHAGVGFTSFAPTATYTLAGGSIREVTLAAGRASVTLNQTCFVQVRPEVIDSLLANSMPEEGDLYSHVVVRPEDWNSIRPLCLEYVQSFVDTFYCR